MKFTGSIPPELITAIKNNKCILFVGAGISSKIKRTNGKNLPTWGNFLKELLDFSMSKNVMFWNGSEEIKNIIDKKNFLLAAQELQECTSLGEFAEFLNLVFRDPNVVPTETHKNIYKIPFRAILTTNYDSLLEGAFTLTHNGLVPIKFTQEDLKTISSPLRNDDFFIFKVHGDIDRPESIILGSRNYNQILFRTPEYLHFLETLFTTHTVLFVGFSGNDVDMDFVIDRLSSIYSRTLHKHYILLPDNKYNLTEKRRLLLDKRIEVIDYEYDSQHKEVDYFFNSLNDILLDKKIEDNKEIGESISKEVITRPTKIKKRNSDAIIISTSKFFDKNNSKIEDLLISLFNGWMWYFGINSIQSKSYKEFNNRIQSADIVIIFIDDDLLQDKELQSFFELLILREIEHKLKIIPIAILKQPNELPMFLQRRTVYFDEINAEDLKAIITKTLEL